MHELPTIDLFFLRHWISFRQILRRAQLQITAFEAARDNLILLVNKHLWNVILLVSHNKWMKPQVAEPTSKCNHLTPLRVGCYCHSLICGLRVMHRSKAVNLQLWAFHQRPFIFFGITSGPWMILQFFASNCANLMFFAVFFSKNDVVFTYYKKFKTCRNMFFFFC